VSYDLFFRSRSPTSRFSRDDFVRHFTGRPHYEVNESQAWYCNEDSGVYFAFDFIERDRVPEAEEESDSCSIPVAFNLNYFRPHAFGLEAEPEVAAFVHAFNLTVSDPQMSGMGDGEYSAEGFLRGWNAGNAFGYRAMISQDHAQTFLTLPSSRIEALWRWNFNRELVQVDIADKAFVLVPRQRLAPRRWFRSNDDIVVFTWRELEPIVRRFRQRSSEPSSHELFYEATPSDIERAIREKQPPAEMPKGVDFDQILDREVLEQAKGQLTNG
jgi:hypothetical protein